MATPWLVARPTDDVLEFATPQKLVRVEAESGAVQEPIELAHDTRIAPVAVEEGYLIVSQSRGKTVRRVDKEGHPVWERQLPGYAMMHPAVLGKLAVFHTRGESYGGQQTVCLDIDSGKIRWSEVLNAYGYGAAFFDEETFLVESDTFLSPEKSEAWLICRDPQTGARRWHHRHAGGIAHPPLVDRKTARVYVTIGRGQVVCLRGEDGSVVWEKSLPEPALGNGSANSYDPAWSPHTLRGNRLLIMDRNLVLHGFDAKTGENLASVALTAGGLFAHSPYTKLIAPPWLTDDGTLIAAFSEGVVAYPIPKGLLEMQ